MQLLLVAGYRPGAAHSKVMQVRSSCRNFGNKNLFRNLIRNVWSGKFNAVYTVHRDTTTELKQTKSTLVTIYF
jgi:hypothetical protein